MFLTFKGRKHTQETKVKMRRAQLGRKFSVEHRKNLSLSHKNIPNSESQKEKIRQTLIRIGHRPPIRIGWHHSQESIEKIRKGKTGKPRPDLSEYNRKHIKRGEQSPAWKGGITPENKAIRSSKRYKKWRMQVFKRDNWTCRFCKRKKEVSSSLHADHIKQFAYFPSLRFKVSNGRTLCKNCHEKTPTYKNSNLSIALLSK